MAASERKSEFEVFWPTLISASVAAVSAIRPQYPKLSGQQLRKTEAVEAVSEFGPSAWQLNDLVAPGNAKIAA